MSFIDSAAEVLDRAEASLHSLISDALKGKAYREVTAIATMAESLSAINAGRSGAGAGRRASAPEMTPPPVAAEAAKASSEPSWMRPKS
ncbi:MAG: hypothetical protein A3F70_03755 [Acidobacteria bacterium RIFCSPLOWO2_12_FULL_67_14]|nr:MAG: hypothetical protein A3H29_15990 [Acidobacteria bacterium RIFCSPLOWO2_02_FULL_67_21]OFW40112.1 MAG: hypothetical protein A3F70_03755 [Acidobacteria bacterium RIFCSPLOWO2_12_FULL_67_14]